MSTSKKIGLGCDFNPNDPGQTRLVKANGQYIKQIDLGNLPNHVAVIMDGNGRWAKSFGKRRIFGHTSGISSVRETIESCVELGIKNLTLYVFSIDNWKRPKSEVNALMKLLVRSVNNEITDINIDNSVRYSPKL